MNEQTSNQPNASTEAATEAPNVAPLPDEDVPAADEHSALAAQLAALQQERDALAQQLARERHARLQLDAALRVGLPPELAERLQGEDAAALAEDAARLAALLPTRRNTRLGHSTQQAASRAQQIFQRIGGGDQNAFDVLLQKRVGGGAFRADDA